jgi:hypothetical protein
MLVRVCGCQVLRAAAGFQGRRERSDARKSLVRVVKGWTMGLKRGRGERERERERERVTCEEKRSLCFRLLFNGLKEKRETKAA